MKVIERIAAAVAIVPVLSWACAETTREQERETMMRQIRAGSPPVRDEAVLSAVARVPRHEFVPESIRGRAYENRPQPIGEGQTISQPYIVALMTELAGVDESSKVLEIGTGSGYQAAVLAELVDHVYTIEIVEVLAARASETLARLGYDNVTVLAADGFNGWPEHAPFDAVVVTAAPSEIPRPLLDQLAVGGRLVIPVGPQGRTQVLKVVTRVSEKDYETRNVAAVIFVPFTRDDTER